MRTYFTSDWHLGHENIIKYSKRPFENADHMDRVIINNYNSTVGPLDVCYFVGDVGFCGYEKMKNYISKLNGIKILILGNHDRGTNAMHNIGFHAVMNGAVLWIAKQRVTISHCPLYDVKREDTSQMRGATELDNWHGVNRPTYKEQYSFKDEGQFHLHGHIHSPNSGKSVKILDRQYDVGVDANNYRPVNISVIESWIAKYGRTDDKL